MHCSENKAIQRGTKLLKTAYRDVAEIKRNLEDVINEVVDLVHG